LNAYALPSDPWMPHVYIMRCTINAPLLRKVQQVDSVEPDWLRRLRPDPQSWGNIVPDLLSRVFVKVGSTYSRSPSERTNKLSISEVPNPTMTCRDVPIIGSHVIAFIPGGYELEKALHRHWEGDRIDSSREFFWFNSEMRELATLYKEYTERRLFGALWSHHGGQL